MRRSIVFVLVIGALLVSARYLSSARAMAIDYWTVDDLTLGVGVVGGSHDSCYIVETAETASEIRITAECREPFFPGFGAAAVGKTYPFEVHLSEPLGERVVLDGVGNPANPCRYPSCVPPS